MRRDIVVERMGLCTENMSNEVDNICMTIYYKGEIVTKGLD